jgi:hypothetical protein
MKRKLAGLLAALLVLSMGTTVYAATSPTAEDIEAQAKDVAEVVTDANATYAGGTMVTLKLTPLDKDTYLQTVDEVESLGTSTTLLGAVDLEKPVGYTEGKSITVTLHLSEITDKDGKDNIRVLHLNGSTWETIEPNAVSEGSVTVTLKSLSPVAVVRTATAVAASETDSNTQSESKNRTTTDANETSGSNSNTNTSNTGSSSSGGNTQTNNNYQTVNVYTNGNGTSASAQPSASTSTTSPKTGASLPALPILAVLAAMGIAVCGKKARSLS